MVVIGFVVADVGHELRAGRPLGFEPGGLVLEVAALKVLEDLDLVAINLVQEATVTVRQWPRNGDLAGCERGQQGELR